MFFYIRLTDYRLFNSLVFNHMCLVTLVISFNYYYNILFPFYYALDIIFYFLYLIFMSHCGSHCDSVTSLK